MLRRGQPPSVSAQRANIGVAIAAIAEVATHHDVIVTHGNGPQVGLLALLSESYPSAAPAVATMLTQTAVDAGDPALLLPTNRSGRCTPQMKRSGSRLSAGGWSPLMALASAASSPPPNPARSHNGYPPTCVAHADRR